MIEQLNVSIYRRVGLEILKDKFTQKKNRIQTFSNVSGKLSCITDVDGDLF